MNDMNVSTQTPIRMSVDQTVRIVEAISPTVTLTRTEDGLRVTVIDKSGTHESMIYDGTNGTDGQTGPQGDPGPMPVLSIGNVVTGDPGSSVTVTLTGTSAEPVLNMSIPKGDKGNTGDTGATGNGIANVVVNQDYTLTITMTNGQSYTSSSIRGEKGATGDTGATGATPDFSIGTVTTGEAGSSASATITGTAEAPVLNLTIPKGDDGDATVDDTAGAGDTSHVWSANKTVSELGKKADIITEQDSVSASVKTLPDCGAYPLGVKVGIEPVQSGTGDPSPTNVRAISGRSAVKISRTGKNLFDKTKITDGYYFKEDGTIGESNAFAITDYMPVNAGGILYYKGLTYIGTSPRSVFYDENKSFLSSFRQKTTNVSAYVTDDIPSGARWVRFTISIGAQHTDQNTFMVVSGSEIGEYEAYNGDAITITFPETPGTVYGGTLEVYKDGTGKLTVDRTMYTLPEVDSIDTASSGIKYKEYIIQDGNALKDNSIVCVISEVAKSYSYNSRPSNAEYCIVRNNSNSSSFVVRAGTTTTLEEFNGMYAGTKIVYLLATTTEYTLTSEQVGQITTLFGTNNIWSDTGDIVSIEYPADTKLYVDRKAAETRKLIELIITANREDAMKATKAYSSGDLLIVNGTLYKATASIANGATITVGTNVTETTVASEIAALA